MTIATTQKKKPAARDHGQWLLLPVRQSREEIKNAPPPRLAPELCMLAWTPGLQKKILTMLQLVRKNRLAEIHVNFDMAHWSELWPDQNDGGDGNKIDKLVKKEQTNPAWDRLRGYLEEDDCILFDTQFSEDAALVNAIQSRGPQEKGIGDVLLVVTTHNWWVIAYEMDNLYQYFCTFPMPVKAKILKKDDEDEFGIRPWQMKLRHEQKAAGQ